MHGTGIDERVDRRVVVTSVLVAGAIVTVYALCLVALAALGVHRLVLAWASGRDVGVPADRPDLAPRAPAVLPRVTVQLPLFEEPEVAARVIAAAGALRWPRELLHVQVLDDSRDGTTAIAADAVARLCGQGIRATLHHREHRRGFKAGALADGLAATDGALILILDADFLPPADLLERLVPRLVPGVGVVQARWGHLNGDESWLTRAQRLFLDAHFALEHGGRQALGCWSSFNGTAGLWRREAIEAAGGWSHDTLTEDLDLSYRAQLAGWRLVYAHDVVVPAELPPTVAAFQAQQSRWARGGVQTARKLLWRILTAPLPMRVRAEAFAHLTGNAGYLASLAVALLLPVVVPARQALGIDAPRIADLVLFAVAVVPFVIAYVVAAWRVDGPRALRRLGDVPVALAVGTSMGLGQSLAALRGLGAGTGVFERTPKRGAAAFLRDRAPRPALWAAQLALAAWLAGGIGWAVATEHPLAVPFQGLFLAGYGLLGAAGLRRSIEARAPASSGTGQVAHHSHQGSAVHAPVSSTAASTR